MNTRMILAVVVGSLLAFGWGAVAWTSGLYDFAFKPLRGGSEVAARIDGLVTEDAAYFYPPMPDPQSLAALTTEQAKIVNEQFRAEHTKGPLMLVLMRKQGVDPTSPTVLLRGYLIEFFATALLAAIMGIAAKFGAKVQDRIGLAFTIAAFTVIATHAVFWNFMHFPDSYSIAVAVDSFVSWLLAGLACALIIRPARA